MRADRLNLNELIPQVAEAEAPDLRVDLDATTRRLGVLSCPACGGWGVVRAEGYDVNGFSLERACAACDGSGAAIWWVIVLGGAEPLHPAWARSIRDQCAAAGVPFWFEGWGRYVPSGQTDRPLSPATEAVQRAPSWGTALTVEQIWWDVGPERSGCLLDGREHGEMPDAVRARLEAT